MDWTFQLLGAAQACPPIVLRGVRDTENALALRQGVSRQQLGVKRTAVKPQELDLRHFVYPE